MSMPHSRYHPRVARKRAVLAALILLLCAGCSRVKLGYPWADWLLERRIGSYLDLDGKQEGLAEKRVAEFLVWHRGKALPGYAAFLRKSADHAGRGALDPETFEQVFGELDALYRETMRATVPGMAELFALQKAEQIDHFEKYVAEEQAELAKDAERPPEERLRKRVYGLVDVLEDFVGELSAAQRARLETDLRQSKSSPAPWLENRKAHAASVVQAMRRGADRAEMETLLRGWWLGEGPAASAEYRRYSDAFMGEMRAMIQEVLASLDAEQRAFLVKTLRAYAADFEDLSRS